MFSRIAVAVACLVGCGNAPPPAAAPATTATVERTAAPPPTVSSETPPPPDATPAPLATDDPQAALASGKERGRGTVLVFCAQWAVACREVDRAFGDPEVKKAIDAKFVTARVDMTNDEAPEVARNTKTFKVKGVPTILVYDKRGKEVAREMSLVDAPGLLAMLAKAK